jgi:hypothetical protein
MLRAILLACALACVASPAFAQWDMFQGPWNKFAQGATSAKLAPVRSRGTVQGYARASASRSCLTGDTRAVLNRLEARIGKVQVISTCRPGAKIAGTNRQSKHAIGRAVDFNTRRKGEAIAFLRSQGVFVMTYCNMGHVHFNTGQSGASFCGKGYASARKRRR